MQTRMEPLTICRRQQASWNCPSNWIRHTHLRITCWQASIGVSVEPRELNESTKSIRVCCHDQSNAKTSTSADTAGVDFHGLSAMAIQAGEAAEQSPPPQFPQPVLLTNALHGDMTAQPLWHSDHEIVCFPEEWAVLVDTRTHVTTPLTAFNKRFANVMPSGGTTAISPDGRWLLWQNIDPQTRRNVWRAATLDGLHQREWPRDIQYQSPKVAWMRDSRHWMELGGYPQDGRQMGALTFSVDAPSISRRVITFPADAQSSALAITPDNHAVLASFTGEAVTDGFYDLTTTPGTSPLRKAVLQPPADVLDCALSHDGTRVRMAAVRCTSRSEAGHQGALYDLPSPASSSLRD